jgi:hypothetical protein
LTENREMLSNILGRYSKADADNTRAIRPDGTFWSSKLHNNVEFEMIFFRFPFVLSRKVFRFPEMHFYDPEMVL